MTRKDKLAIVIGVIVFALIAAYVMSLRNKAQQEDRELAEMVCTIFYDEGSDLWDECVEEES